MTNLLQWPPQQYSTFTVRGRLFEWEGSEPFVVFMRDGTVDTDPIRLTKGFINRVHRYGRQNGFSEEEWSLQAIYSEISARIPPRLRPKFFAEESTSPTPNPMSLNPHQAPVPLGLAAAAGFDAVADDDPDLPRALAGLTPDQWLATLKRWVDADPARKQHKKLSGPAFWWSLHSLAKNPASGTTPLNFVGMWLSQYPCRLCRMSFRRYIAQRPVPDWAGFEAWADAAHNHVTSHITALR